MLLDLQGRAVQTANWNGQASGRQSIDLGNLAPGMYTIQLTDGNGQWRLPVVRFGGTGGSTELDDSSNRLSHARSDQSPD